MLKKIFSLFARKQDPYLRVRFSKPEDQEKVFRFYTDNTHKHVDQRKPELWNDRTKNGRVIIIEDNESHIGFVSVSYDFEVQGQIKWKELGSTINVQNPDTKPYDLIKGMTLYPYLVSAQTVQEFLTFTPEDKLIANVYDDNPAVIHMLNNRAHWDIFEPEQAILTACKATKGDRNEHGAKRVWLTATSQTLPKQARIVLEFIEKAEKEGFYNKRSEKNIKFDLSSFSLANEFRAAVEALAHGPFSEKLENSPAMGMKATRAALDQYLQQGVQSPPPTLK